MIEKDKDHVVQRNYNIDLLKILACLAVVCMHTIHNTISVVNLVICYTCTFAIPVIFASSGFILLHRKEATYRYSLKKVLHIIRITFIWSFLVESLVFIAKAISGKNLSVLSFIANITYRPYIQSGNMWQFWYLGALAIIYMVLPLLHGTIKGSWKNWLCIWIIFCIICMVFQSASIYAGEPVQKDIIQTFRLWTWTQYFLAGGYILHYIFAVRKNINKATRHYICSMDNYCSGISGILRKLCDSRYTPGILLWWCYCDYLGDFIYVIYFANQA